MVNSTRESATFRKRLFKVIRDLRKARLLLQQEEP